MTSRPGESASPAANANSRNLFASLIVACAVDCVGGHLAVDQHTVAQRQPVVGGDVEEGDVDGDVEIPRPRAVDVDREGVEHLLRRQLAMIDGDAVCVGVPKLPSRSSVAPERKKLRQTAFSEP